jgi:hypothetical protein
MPIIRRKLQASDVYPDDIRYNSDTGTVQSLVNGTWTDNPAADPRTQTTFPPRSSSDPKCDAAQSVTDAFKGQIDGVLAAIGGSQTAFTIAGIILSLFTFGVFGIFISLALFLAHTMLDAGTTAINAALTTTAYHTFMCILDCHMDSSGRLNTGELGAVESDVSAQIGGLGATILNQMLNLAGEGGVNNLASLGTSTGDCFDCDCTPPCDISGWTLYSGTSIAKNVTTGHWTIAAVFDSGLYGGYGLIVQSGDDSACCHIGYAVISGGVTIALKIACGGAAYPTGGFSGGGLDGDLRSILLASTAAFTVDLEFDPP